MHTGDSLLCTSMPTSSLAGLHSPAALTAFEWWGFRATTVEAVASRLVHPPRSAFPPVAEGPRLQGDPTVPWGADEVDPGRH